MLGQNFPISEYLRPHIIDATSISRTGGWWTAVLLIRDPKSEKPYLALYRWQKREAGWKKVSSFKINSADQLAKVKEALDEFSAQMGSVSSRGNP